MNQTVKVLLVLNLLVLLAILARSYVVERFAAAQSSASIQAKDNQELALLMDEDQVDRTPSVGKSIDWKIVATRDESRLKRVKELYSQNQLRTGLL